MLVMWLNQLCASLMAVREKCGKYAAPQPLLGKLDDSRRFCTYQHNIQEFKQHIDYERLTQDVQGCSPYHSRPEHPVPLDRFLCIIQEDDDDWAAESCRMEDIFSSAYCTLAASSAESSDGGFLEERSPRPCIQIDTDRGLIYLCKSIDDFRLDVEEGILNKRG